MKKLPPPPHTRTAPILLDTTPMLPRTTPMLSNAAQYSSRIARTALILSSTASKLLKPSRQRQEQRQQQQYQEEEEKRRSSAILRGQEGLCSPLHIVGFGARTLWAARASRPTTTGVVSSSIGAVRVCAWGGGKLFHGLWMPCGSSLEAGQDVCISGWEYSIICTRGERLRKGW